MAASPIVTDAGMIRTTTSMGVVTIEPNQKVPFSASIINALAIAQMKNAPQRVRFIEYYWCREPESNRHGVTTAGF